MDSAIETRPRFRLPGLGVLAPALAAAALFLVPWAYWLARTLPASHTARHWAIAWAGFDGALALALAATAISALRRSPWLVAAASATGTLLLVDAWFDILTAHGGGELTLAAAEAVFVELPLAALSFWIVRDAEQAIQRLCECLRIRHLGAKPTAAMEPRALAGRTASPEKCGSLTSPTLGRAAEVAAFEPRKAARRQLTRGRAVAGVAKLQRRPDAVSSLASTASAGRTPASDRS